MIPVKAIRTNPPGYRPSNDERETIIRFDETQAPATVYTFNPAMIRKIDALTDERPEEVSCIKAESINGVEMREYTIPKKWVKVRASRILSEAEREKLAEVGRQLHQTAK